MKDISREDLQHFPEGAHVVEIIPGEDQCRLHEHFAGAECHELRDLGQFTRTHAKEEPVVVHCLGGVDCRLATALLEYAGFDRVYHYEGRLEDLKPFAWREAVSGEPALPREGAERPAAERGFEHLPPWLPGGPGEETRVEERKIAPEERPREMMEERGEAKRGFEHLPAWLPSTEEREEPFVELSEAAFKERLARERAELEGPYVDLSEEAARERRAREMRGPETWPAWLPESEEPFLDLDEITFQARLARERERIREGAAPEERGPGEYRAGDEAYRESLPQGAEGASLGVVEETVVAETYVELEARRLTRPEEGAARPGKPPVIGPDQLSAVIKRAPSGHALLLDVARPESCERRSYVFCLPTEEFNRLPDIVGNQDVVVFHALNEQDAQKAYRSLQRTQASAIYRLEGDFEDWLPEA